jgi:hypothetical protein
MLGLLPLGRLCLPWWTNAYNTRKPLEISAYSTRKTTSITQKLVHITLRRLCLSFGDWCIQHWGDYVYPLEIDAYNTENIQIWKSTFLHMTHIALQIFIYEKVHSHALEYIFKWSKCQAWGRFLPSISCKWYVLALITLITLKGLSYFKASLPLPPLLFVTFNFQSTKSPHLNFLFLTLRLWYWVALSL